MAIRCFSLSLTFEIIDAYLVRSMTAVLSFLSTKRDTASPRPFRDKTFNCLEGSTSVKYLSTTLCTSWKIQVRFCTPFVELLYTRCWEQWQHCFITIIINPDENTKINTIMLLLSGDLKQEPRQISKNLDDRNYQRKTEK